MATLLLVVIYIAYIGLGVPDALFGFLAQAISASLFPYYIGAFFTLFVLAIVRLVSILKKQGRYEIQFQPKITMSVK